MHAMVRFDMHAMVRLAQYRSYLGKSWFKAKNTTSWRFDIKVAFLIQISLFNISIDSPLIALSACA